MELVQNPNPAFTVGWHVRWHRPASGQFNDVKVYYPSQLKLVFEVIAQCGYTPAVLVDAIVREPGSYVEQSVPVQDWKLKLWLQDGGE